MPAAGDGTGQLINSICNSCLLYNINNDREERTDLARSKPELVATLSARLDKLLAGMQAELPTPNPDFKEGVGDGKFNLEYTRELAEKERASFKALIERQ